MKSEKIFKVLSRNEMIEKKIQELVSSDGEKKTSDDVLTPLKGMNFTDDEVDYVFDVLSTQEDSDEDIEKMMDLDHLINVSEADDYMGDSVNLYLKDISRYPLLTKDEEISLFKIIEEGRKAEVYLEGFADTLHCDNSDLFLKAIEDSKRAKMKVVESNLRLVVSIARHYMNNDYGLQILDLIQDGNLGLIKAVDKFEYSRGYRFSTYAVWWIKQNIARAIADKHRMIRIPVHTSEQIRLIRKVIGKLTSEYQREPTVEEIAQEAKISVRKLNELLELKDATSIDKPVGEEEDVNLSDLIADNKAASPEEAAIKEAMKNDLRLVMDEKLSEREREVIDLRFGLTTEDPLTLDVIGKMKGCTRERIRQIEAKALYKMQKSRLLQEYLA